MTRAASLVCAVIAIGGALALPVAAAAKPLPPQSAQLGPAGSLTGLPLQRVPSLAYVPPGFSTSGGQAVAAAEATREMQALHRTHHPLVFQAAVWAGSRWETDFYFKGRLLAEVDVSPSGRVTAIWTGPLALDYAARGHFSGLFDSPWVVLSFGLLFLLPFVDWRRPFRLLHLDLLVLLSFGISYWLFNATHFESAVLLVYPPLLYLLGRMLVIGLRKGGRRSEAPRSSWPIAVLAVGLVALVGTRIGLDLAYDKVIDVGYASVIGAHRLVHGLPLYYVSGSHPDTYGPVAYLAYVPFERLFPWSGRWDYLPAAHAAAISFDVLTVAALVLLGRRLRAGAAGWRLGLSLGWAWAAFPFTLLGLMNNTNDGLIAMLFVFTLLALASPARRGVLLGLAVAAKFFPVVLVPVIARGIASHTKRRRAVVSALACTVACAIVIAATVVLFLPSGGISELYNHTIGFQLGRTDVFSLWGLHPSLSWLKTVVLVAALLLAALVGLLPRADRNLAQVAALAAAVVIAIQLPAEHWFYFYLVWFAPLVLVAVLARDAAVVVNPHPRSRARRQRRTRVPRPQPLSAAVAKRGPKAGITNR